MVVGEGDIDCFRTDEGGGGKEGALLHTLRHHLNTSAVSFDPNLNTASVLVVLGLVVLII